MSDRLIITLPISPFDKMTSGRMISPILGESLAKSMNCDFIMAVNALSSYKGRDYSSFLELMKHYNIKPHDYWIDEDHIEELINKVYSLIEMGFISINEKELLCCQCGRVEIPKDNIDSINLKDSLFEKVSGKYCCKYCKSECQFVKNRSLVFNPRLIDKSHMQFYPVFINKDKFTFDETVGNNDIVISRKRDTGIKIYYNGLSFNLDIDFLWQVFLSLFSAKEKIVMCGNHQLYQLYMVGMLEKCFNPNSNTVCLATPFLIENMRQTELQDRILSLKIFSLLVLKWARKENTFDLSLLQYINTMNVKKKQMLYDILVEEVETTQDISNDLRLILTKKYNVQNANAELKRRRQNV